MTEKAPRRPAKPARSSTAVDEPSQGFTDEERAAMRERAREVKAESRRGSKPNREDDEAAVLAKIAEMPQADRALGERLHAVIKASAPSLSPKLWYGMPAYALDGKVVCFFQNAQKFKTRYSTLGFSDLARLDDGALWPTSYALTELTPEVEEKVSALVKRAVG